MLKKLIAILSVLALLFVFAGCSEKKQEEDPLVGNYRNIAQSFIDAGDYDAAIATLEEGVAATEAESLKKMLTDVQAKKAELEAAAQEEAAKQEEANAALDYTKFAGSWAFDDEKYDALKLEISGTTVKFRYTNISASDRIAEVSGEGQIADNKLTYQYDNDGWGNKGTLIIEFVSEGIIRTEVKDVTYDPNHMFNLREGSRLLVPYVREYDDVVGKHNDVNNSGLSIDIYYDGTAAAEIVFDTELDPLVVELYDRSGNTFYGICHMIDWDSTVVFRFDPDQKTLTAEIDHAYGSDPEAYFGGTIVFAIN